MLLPNIPIRCVQVSIARLVGLHFYKPNNLIWSKLLLVNALINSLQPNRFLHWSSCLSILLYFYYHLKGLTTFLKVPLPSYLTFYQGSSRLRNCRFDCHSLGCSIISRSSQSLIRCHNPLSKSFFYRTHLLWNALLLEPRQICWPRSFRSKLEKHSWASL